MLCGLQDQQYAGSLAVVEINLSKYLNQCNNVVPKILLISCVVTQPLFYHT